jgi:hypothetical protein
MVFGINASSGYSVFVGAYWDTSNNVRGFYAFGPGPYPVDLQPDPAVLSYATAVNSPGVILGRWDTPDGNTHGYLWASGSFTMIDVPEAVSTIAWAINDTRTIVGEYADGNGTTHGFRTIGAQFEIIDFPAATSTTVHGVSGTTLVGSYTDVPGVTHGFLMTP